MSPHSKCILSSCVRVCWECCIQPKYSPKPKMKALGKWLETQPAVSCRLTGCLSRFVWPFLFFLLPGHVFPQLVFPCMLSPWWSLRVYFCPKKSCMGGLIHLGWTVWWCTVEYSTAGWMEVVTDSCFRVIKVFCCSQGGLFTVLVVLSTFPVHPLFHRHYFGFLIIYVIMDALKILKTEISCMLWIWWNIAYIQDVAPPSYRFLERPLDMVLQWCGQHYIAKRFTLKWLYLWHTFVI